MTSLDLDKEQDKDNMTTHYVVVEVADEYNDEVYQLQDGGTPIAVFSTKEEAQALRNQKQYAKLRGLEIRLYAYDIEDLARDPKDGWSTRSPSLTDVVEALPFLNKTDEPDDWQDYMFPLNLTDEQYAQIDNVFKSLSFFDVVEVTNQ